MSKSSKSTHDLAKRGAIRKGNRTVPLTQKQLAGVGSIVMSFTKTEYALRSLLTNGLGLSRDLGETLAVKLNNDQMVDILKTVMSDFMRLPKDTRQILAHTLGGFSTCKRYRDNIVHSHVIDATNGIGLRFPYKGEAFNVVINDTAIDGINKRLEIILEELGLLATIFQLMGVRIRIDPAFVGDLEKGLGGPALQGQLEKVQALQKRRFALPLLPELPDDN